jgi:NAD(P)-dependent dehydrogenase (short-subunit alcohol dehydrogenase family)
VINPFLMNNKTILVTGASSGIGKRTAIQLAELGATVILVGRDTEKLNDTFNRLPANKHIIAPFDLNQADLLSNWLKELVGRAGTIHGLAHCAGVHLIKPLKLMEPQDYKNLLETNVGTAFNLCKAFCQRTVAARPASIVFVSSAAGLQGQAGISAYSASKGAIVALVKSLAMEFAAEKIRVNCVVPGVVSTPMTDKLFNKMNAEQIAAIQSMHPLGFGSPQDVAHAITFLLSDASSWITGTGLVVDGGYCAH